MFSFQLRRTRRASSEAVVVLADHDIIRRFARLSSVYDLHLSAAQRVGWNFTTGYIFPVYAAEGGRDRLPLSAARATAVWKDICVWQSCRPTLRCIPFEWEVCSANPLPRRPWSTQLRLMAGRQGQFRGATSEMPLH